MVNGRPIREYQLPKTNVTVSYSIELEEQEARMFAGIGIAEYETMPGTPDWCDENYPLSKSDVIVMYRMHHLIAAVQEHARSKQPARRR